MPLSSYVPKGLASVTLQDNIDSSIPLYLFLCQDVKTFETS